MDRPRLILTSRGLRHGARVYPCTIGKGGLVPAAAKREGDGATPMAVLRLVMTLYRPDRMARPAPWARAIRPGDLWSDAPEDPAYNKLVRAPYAPSCEALRRSDPLYDLIMVTDWNWPRAVPGRGSCIFIHQWRRPGYPTEGCVALRRGDLHELAARLRPGTELIIPDV